MSLGGSGTDQDFDLNIAPIIDCFTVLIAYMLLSASFVSMGVFDVGVSVVSESASTSPPPQTPELSVSIELRADRGIVLKTSGSESASISISGRDYSSLRARVRELKSRFPSITEASISADAQVEYREIVQAIESLREELPRVTVADQV